VQAGRNGDKVVLWGQVRTGAGVQSYRVQVRSGGVWRFVGGTRRTDARGYLTIAVPATRGSLVRTYASRDGSNGAALFVR